ncbi:MAG: efflux RND transporter periplasmic adaptor subunit [Chitinispirillales bacterium]|jgi:RND family efflux transporter MFP subunit|nr:efflux RND transporter periplasmic adaptor subunit [Chitinispirillales bacterium]
MSKLVFFSKFPLICAVAVIFATGFGCGKKDDSLDDVERIVLPVRGAAAIKRDVVRSLNFTGSIDAHRRAAIAPAAAAMGSRVSRIYVEEGQAVREGQLLVRLEDYLLKQSAAQIAMLEADFNRMQALYDRRSIPLQQFEQARTAFAAAKAEYDLLKNSIELRAPFSGTIIGRYVNEGEIYRGVPGYDGTVGVLAIAQLDKMEIEVMVSEQEFVRLRYGQLAQVTLDAFPGRVFEGRIATIAPAISQVSRTANVTISIVDEKKELRPGMFAKVEIAIEARDDVLAVPLSAIVVRGGDSQTYVFTVEGQETPFVTTPRQRQVKLGLLTLGYVEVLEGIEENAIVLVDNNAHLIDETEILVTEVQR